MALPPSIPTSFVPRSASATFRQPRDSFVGTFGFFSYMVLGIVFVLALSVFFYGRILDSSLAAREAALTKAQKAVDVATVEGFIQLRDRLNSGSALLNKHVALSGFFKLLGTLLPSSARFTSLHITVTDAGKVSIDAFGVARNFNALAAVSTAFAKDGHIRDAIFSNIVITRDNSVSFALSASVDPKVVAFTP